MIETLEHIQSAIDLVNEELKKDLEFSDKTRLFNARHHLYEAKAFWEYYTQTRILK